MYLGIGDLDGPWPPGVYCGPAVKVKVKVKVTLWDQRGGSTNLLTRCTLGLVTEVHHGPGVYRGPGG